MEVYVLYDCVENPDEWAFVGVEHVYDNWNAAYARMEVLYNECKEEYLNEEDEDGVRDTYIDGWGACVENTITGYRHTWNITKEKVANYSERE